MDAKTEIRIHRPHLPNAVRKNMPEVLREIESAIDDFTSAGTALLERFDQESAQRVWTSSRVAWALLLPHRQPVLRERRFLVQRFCDLAGQLHDFLQTRKGRKDATFQRLAEDLARRKALLSALLAENGEPRIRELLNAERMAAGVG